MYLEVPKIPENNILRRWTKEAVVYKSNAVHACTEADENKARKRALLLETLRLVNDPCAIEESVYHQAMDLLGRAACTNNTAADITTSANNKGSDSAVGVPLACPERTMKGGRPPATGLNAWLSKQSKNRKKEKRNVEESVMDWPDEENPPLKKTKRVSEIKQ